MKILQLTTCTATLALLAGCSTRTEPADTAATAETGSTRTASSAPGPPATSEQPAEQPGAQSATERTGAQYSSTPTSSGSSSQGSMRSDESTASFSKDESDRQPVAGLDTALPEESSVSGDSSSSAAQSDQEPSQVLQGKATYYHPSLAGKTTTSGEPYDPDAMTAAMKDLELGSMVRVVRKDTGASVLVRVNDRLPHERGATIDLSSAAAEKLDMKEAGIVPVRILVMKQPGDPSSDDADQEQAGSRAPSAGEGQ